MATAKPLIITVDDHQSLDHVAKILKAFTEQNLSIAIVGAVYTGKTWLLEQVMDDLKRRKNAHILSDFDSLINRGEGTPRYVCVDHSASPEAMISTVRKVCPGIPLLATFYDMPENGFDVIVELRVAPWSLFERKRVGI